MNQCARTMAGGGVKAWITGVVLAAGLVVGVGARGQAPHALSAGERDRVESLIKQMTLEQKLAYIGGTGFAVRAVPEVKLPAIEMSDGPYGTRSNSGFPSTTYGAGIGMAASWDRELAKRVGAGIGRDARARGVHYMLGPGVNIYRSPRNGRNFEYFGEDPFLAGQVAANYIVGMQEQGVSATVKHFLGNNSEYLRHDSDTVMDERTAREIYLPAFEAAVKQGHVGAVMDSYNLINGKHATENPHFNIDVLRKDWGFEGVLMSDWDATYDGVAAANGGLDIEMPTGKFMNAKNLLPALKAGQVSEATIDEKVRRLLRLAMSYGWLDRDQRDVSMSLMDARNEAAALQSAREGAVLLKNQGNLLPLDKANVKTVLVVGPDAYPGVVVGGGSAGVVPFEHMSAFLGIQAGVGAGTKVLYDPGVPSLAQLAGDTRLRTKAQGGEEGVTAEFFGGLEMSGDPVASGVVRQVSVSEQNFQMMMGGLGALLPKPGAEAGRKVSHRFTGYYDAGTAGKYIVALEASGEGSGKRVRVDGKVVIDDWTLVKAFQPAVTLDLSAGMHKVEVEQWQRNAVGGRLVFAIVPESRVVNRAAVTMAKAADAVIVEAGYRQESEGEGGDRTFALPFGQDELIREMAAANAKTVVVLTSGGNVDSRGWIERVPALLETWYAGQAGGTAQAEILFGAVNPSGHLPVTYERAEEDNPTFANYYPEGDTRRVEYKEGIFVGYRGYEKNGVQPLFPFGFGLSYTTFRFANLKLAQAGSGGGVTASFDVTNTGKRKGAEVAQVYVGEDQPKVARPAHELKGFERVELGPGETRHLTIPLDARAFSYWDVGSGKWVVGTEKFTVWVGDSVASLPLKAGVELKR